MHYLQWFRLASGVLAALICLSTGIVSVQAATITVTTTTDELVAPGTGCSLREAIQSVNGVADFGGCTATGPAYGTSDTINVPTGTYTTAIGGPGDDLNATGDYDIRRSVSIVGTGAGPITINGSTIDRVFDVGNTVTVRFSGVTITNGSIGGSGSGGGILNQGTLTIVNSTISGNIASSGGGILNQGTLTIVNSTISGNIASFGGGIFGNGATVTIVNSTISGNTADNGGGGIQIAGQGTATLVNTIVANQSVGPDCTGSLTSNGHNLESGTSCVFTGTGDLQNANPLLGPLADNGGPTQTMALLTGSPAINAGNNGTCASVLVNGVDQRGTARPPGSCDIGAYEVAEAIAVPTLSEWAQIGMAALLVGGGLVAIRRSRQPV